MHGFLTDLNTELDQKNKQNKTTGTPRRTYSFTFPSQDVVRTLLATELLLTHFVGISNNALCYACISIIL